jgi:hypothetical protein
MRLGHVGNTAMWHAAHRAKDQFIGCRVTTKAPVAVLGAVVAPALGRAGLPINDPTSRMEAINIMTVTAIHNASPTGQSSTPVGVSR